MAATFEKSITYTHGDYRAEYEGNTIGFYKDHLAAETALDAYVYELLTSGITRSATELDGGCGDPPNPTCAACHTNDYPASGMQPAFCIECVQAMLHGQDNRFGPSDPVAINWTDRPEPWEVDPPAPGPSDGTGLGDRGSEGDDPDAGRAIARQFHTDPRRFTRILTQLSLDDHNEMATAYSAYMRPFNPAMTPPHALRIWGLACMKFLV
jgi:hypothetical protein